jgi:tryptophan-rich sensory protein
MFLEKPDWLGLIVFVVIQFLGPYVNVNREEYKRGSAKFKGAPPDWLFGPGWIVLKFLRGIAGFLYWNEGPTSLGTAYNWTLSIYVINIILDVQWMPLFFGVKNAGAALVIIVTILLTAIALVVLSAKAGLWLSFAFFLVYLVWIGYATYLNVQWFSKGVWNRLEREDKESLPLPATQERRPPKKKNRSKPKKATRAPSAISDVVVGGRTGMKMPNKFQ